MSVIGFAKRAGARGIAAVMRFSLAEPRRHPYLIREFEKWTVGVFIRRLVPLKGSSFIIP